MTPDPAWIEKFEELSELPPDLRARLLASASHVTMPAGSRIYAPGQEATKFLLLVEGSVRVQQISETGREIVLYRVAPGESCALTSACLMGSDHYPAEAIAETDIEAIAIPRALFDELIARSPAFRRFVFHAFSTRMADLFRIIEEVAFTRLDIRLAHKLLDLTGGADELSVTQQQLAIELGSAREVISRMLAEFQRRHWISLSRGAIRLLDRRALDALAHER
jgi:CRP/FNR family transcriptional regulator